MYLFKSKSEREAIKSLKKEIKEREKINDKFEREAEEELKKEEEKQREGKSKFTIIMNDFFDLLFSSKEDTDLSDLYEYMSDEEIKEYERELSDSKKENRRIIIVLAVILISIGIGMFSFYYYFRPKIEAVSRPIMEEYYYNKFGNKTKLKDLQYLCYEERSNDNKIEKVCTDIIYGYVDSNHVVMSVNNELLGDNISYGNILADYNTYIANILSNATIISNNPLFSYSSYYHTFNKYYNYINCLPGNTNFDTLYNSNKLNIIDDIVYQGNIDFNLVKNFLSKLTDNSEIYFLKVDNSNLSELTIVNKNNIISMPIVGNKIRIDDNISNYEFDSNSNDIASINITNVANSSVELFEDSNYSLGDCYSIEYEERRHRRDEDISLPKYYLIEFNNIGTNLVQFDSTKENELDRYKNIHAFRYSNYTYIVGNEMVNICSKVNKDKGGIFR